MLEKKIGVFVLSIFLIGALFVFGITVGVYNQDLGQTEASYLAIHHRLVSDKTTTYKNAFEKTSIAIKGLSVAQLADFAIFSRSRKSDKTVQLWPASDTVDNVIFAASVYRIGQTNHKDEGLKWLRFVREKANVGVWESMHIQYAETSIRTRSGKGSSFGVSECAEPRRIADIRPRKVTALKKIRQPPPHAAMPAVSPEN